MARDSAMHLISCRFGNVEYPFLLGTDCADEIASRLEGLDANRYFVIADAGLLPLSKTHAIARLAERASVHVLPFRGGEHAKRLTAVEGLLESILGLGATRRSCVVALGGGVTGNVAGMVAALAFRGVRLVHVPTTLVAMLDSVISLKQAVNASYGKNLIGSYYAPVAVLADTAYVRTLSPDHVQSGLCEIVKNALAISPEQIPTIRSLLAGMLGDEETEMLVRLGIESKIKVMTADPHERTHGLVLEYGHTVGHAIEHALHGAITHGRGVAIGMLAAANVARTVAHLSDEDIATHVDLIGRLGVVPRLPDGVTPAELMRALTFDNKRGCLVARDNHIVMVLMEALGRPVLTNALPLTYVPLRALEEALDRLAEPTWALA